MKWNDLSMTERADIIALGVQSGITDLNTIRHTYNSLSEGYLDGNNVVFPKRHRYDGSTEETQQMQMKGKARTAEQARLYPYYDEDYDTSYAKMPSGKTFRNQEALERAIPVLDELVVYPESGKGAKSNTMGGYYDRMNSMTEANREHAARVAEADNIVRETAAFEKPLNFLSPGQWFGAGVDYLQGESPFWKGLYNGNSGWLPDKFAEDNPRLATLLNMAGDVVIPVGTTKLVKPGITKGLKTLGYTKDLPINDNNFYRVVGSDAIDDAVELGRIRAKTGWYHGALNNVLKNWGEYFSDFTLKELRQMDPQDALDILKERMGDTYKNLPRSEKFKINLHFRPSTNHGGTVGFVKGDLFYKPHLDDVVIEATPDAAKFAKGHHGGVDYNAPIEKGNAVVLLDEITGLNKHASVPINNGFSYYERGPIADIPYLRDKLYWKHRKFKTKKK